MCAHIYGDGHHVISCAISRVIPKVVLFALSGPELGTAGSEAVTASDVLCIRTNRIKTIWVGQQQHHKACQCWTKVAVRVRAASAVTAISVGHCLVVEVCHATYAFIEFTLA